MAQQWCDATSFERQRNGNGIARNGNGITTQGLVKHRKGIAKQGQSAESEAKAKRIVEPYCDERRATKWTEKTQ